MKSITDRVLIFICVMALIFFGAGIYLLPADAFSERENRAIAEFPALSPLSIADGSFSRGIGSFYTDRFPLRETFISLKTRGELSLGRRESGGVIFCEDGKIVARPEYSDYALYRKNLCRIQKFCDSFKDTGGDAAFLLAPRSIDVFRDSLPSLYPYERESQVFDIARECSPSALLVSDELYAREAAGEKVWFLTDHHATSLGAYELYAKIMEAFGESPLPRESFCEQKISSEFYGSTARKSVGAHIQPDTLSLMRYEGDEEFLCVDYDTKTSFTGLYRYEFLEQQDKYCVFLGGNYGHLGIYSSTPREKLLIIKDSFANACAPYLALHYDIEIIDLRYFKGRLCDVISECSPSKLLVLYGVQTLVEEPSVQYIER